MVGSIVTVRKLSPAGRELFRYWGELLEQTSSYVKLEAVFDLPDNELEAITFRKGDRFLEWHYLDRWYNVFAVYDVDTRQLKGWYCNITRPAVYRDQVLSAVDLALDLLVQPDGSYQVLDEDEFSELQLASHDREGALAALAQLKNSAEKLSDPFFVE